MRNNAYIGELYEGQYLSELPDMDIVKNFNPYSCEFLNTCNKNDSLAQRNAQTILFPSIIEKNTDGLTQNSVREYNQNENISYSDKIHTMRLIDNLVCEIEEIKTEEKEEIEQLENREIESVFKNYDESDDSNDDKGFEIKSIFKSQKQLSNVVDKHIVPKVIKDLKWAGNILIICLVIIAFTSHFISVLEFQQITNNLNLKILQDRKICEMVYLVQNIQYLVLLNKGLFGANKSDLEKEFKQNMTNSLFVIETIENTLQLSNTQFSEKQQNLLHSDIVKIYFNLSSFKYFDLNQASQQIISKAFNVINMNLTQLSLSDPNVFFVMFNMFNDYYVNLQQMSDYFVMDENYMIERKKNIFVILLILSVLLTFASLLILIPLIVRVGGTKNHVLTLFLDIPPKVLKILCVRCENFITSLQVGEEEDISSERSEAMLDDEDEEDLLNHNEIDGGKLKKKKKYKRKKSKKSSSGQKKFIIVLFFGVCMLEIYFGMNYFLSEKLINQLVPLIKEANDTSKAESIFSFYHMGLRYY